ncbi:Threonine/homoserine efflux transporter RhtA [Jannaschia faecimaris]|uniref:Threonine/homoserine efflux transporter RhtA n=1 Tax=Jannaschia faecimaris TaxID=1244108 RepID=A0A1H3K117_9RHOB|nr:DMT family transporter [Jannaschia faecimaris]SDY45204.1 Threonine/homoserine efflux transporter RhtA [Jannaschia faecimaris]
MTRELLGSVALMFVAMSLIPLGDTAGKLLAVEHGVSSIFVAFSRFAVGAAMIALILGGRVHWYLYRDWRVWLRAGLIAAGIASIQTALKTEDIATVFGAFFIGPIFSYVLSILFLGERVTPLQTLLLVLGFCGVMLVVRPGFGMTPGLGFAMLAGLFYGAFLTASRWLSNIAPPRQLMLSQTVLGTVLLAPFGLIEVPELTLPVSGLVLWSGVASASGNLLLVLAYRRTGATVLAPFVYFQLISATVLGWTVFGTLPDKLALAGLALLVSAGLATIFVRR